MIAAALLAAAAAQPAPVFAPPLERPLTVRTEEERRVGGTVRRFVAEHRIVFRRESRGIIAEVTLVALRTDADGGVARRFHAVAGGLLDRTVRFAVSPTGTVTAVEDEAAVWAAAIRGAGSLAPPRAPGAAPPPGGPLAQLPPARRLAMLAEPLARLLAPGDAALPAGTGAVALPAPGGAVRGSRIVRVEGARATLAIRAADSALGVVVERRRTVDRTTGLLAGQEETVSRTIAGEIDTARSRTIVSGN